MVRRAVDPLPLLLLCIVVFATCYFLVPEPHPDDRSGNVERDHDLGGHRQVKAWGCKKCYP